MAPAALLRMAVDTELRPATSTTDGCGKTATEEGYREDEVSTHVFEKTSRGGRGRAEREREDEVSKHVFEKTMRRTTTIDR
jgi:hypothetical protein